MPLDLPSPLILLLHYEEEKSGGFPKQSFCCKAYVKQLFSCSTGYKYIPQPYTRVEDKLNLLMMQLAS